MIPLSSGGFHLVTGMVIQMGVDMVLDDVWTSGMITVVVVSLEWIACIAVGVWNLVTLMNPDVIAGFEYVAE